MIRVVGADRLTKTIDFKLVDPEADEDESREDYFVEYSAAREVSEQRASKVRKLIERSGEEDKASFKPKAKDGKKSSGRTVDVNGETVDIRDVEPDPRTGKPRLKKGAKDSKTSKAPGRKVYKVHKYKKSATSKAARSAQGKGKRKKR